MKKEITRSEWPVGAILKIRNTIPDRSLVDSTVTVLSGLQEVLGEKVQAIDISGVNPPLPQPCFLARPCDLYDFSNGYSCLIEESLFKFDPRMRVWETPKKSTIKV